MCEVVVVGQIARDLVLCVDSVPAAGRSAPVNLRREMLGGKGANHAVALAQLGRSVALLGVLGDDHVADALLAQARADGVNVAPVVRRAGCDTGLIVDLLDANRNWHYLEHLPDQVLLTENDVAAAAETLRTAPCTVVQLQQPSAAALTAATCAKQAGRLVVLDGAPADDGRRDALLDAADVVRADAREAELMTGSRLASDDEAVQASRDLVERHELSLVAFAVTGGNVFVWPGGGEAIPHVDTDVVDTTGAGDALAAALTSVLCRGGGAEEAARFAVAAAAATVGHPGGRPNLTPERMHRFLGMVDGDQATPG